MVVDSIDRLTVIHEAMFAYDPPNNGQLAAHSEAMRKFNELVDLRRQRIDRVDDGLPSIL